MTKHVHVHIHDSKDGGTSTQRKSGGVTTWGGADPKKVVPKSPIDQLYKKSKDAGTSEGAKKAAETRKSHGGGASPKSIFNAEHYHEQSEKHTNTAKSLAKGGTKEHNAAAELHHKAARLHKQATETGQPEHVAAAKAASNRANFASRKLGHVSHSFK